MNTINDSPKREELFTRLYKAAFPSVAKYIANRGGDFNEAKDVFQDALVIYYEKVIAGDSPKANNDTAYLVGIAKHLWLRRFRQEELTQPLNNFDTGTIEFDETPSAARLLCFLEKAGKKCMELLTGFYYEQLPLTDIAERFGFSGTRSATVQKYKCLEKVRENIKQKALQYEDFME